MLPVQNLTCLLSVPEHFHLFLYDSMHLGQIPYTDMSQIYPPDQASLDPAVLSAFVEVRSAFVFFNTL